MNLDEITRDCMSTLNRIFDELRAALLSTTNSSNSQEIRSLQEVVNAWQIRCKRSVAKVLPTAKSCTDCSHCWRAYVVEKPAVASPAEVIDPEIDPLFLTTSQREYLVFISLCRF